MAHANAPFRSSKMTRSMLSPFGARLCALGMPPETLDEMAGCDLLIEEVPPRSERRSAAPGGSFDVLLHGWAFRFRDLREGTRHIAGLVLPGDPCDIDSVEFGRSNVQLGTLTRCLVASFDGEAFRDLCGRSAIVRQAVTRLSMAENAMLREWNLCLAHRSATQRLAHLFCELHLRLAAVDAAGRDGYELPLTQSHLAELLGLTAVHVNRTLQAMRAERLIELSGQRLIVRDWNALGVGRVQWRLPGDGAGRGLRGGLRAALRRGLLRPVADARC
jgi:CRP-like cAMP-binding protein